MVNAFTSASSSCRRRSLRALLREVYGGSNSGVIEASGLRGLVQIHVKEGRVVRVVPPPGSEWLLGHALVEGGEVREKTLYGLRRRSRKKNRPVEELLVDGGHVSADVLARYVELQVKETILPLFLDGDVPGEFRGEPPDQDSGLRPMSIPYLLKEGERRSAEWEILRDKAPPMTAVFEKSEESLARFFRPEEKQDPKELGAAERLAYYYVNGEKTVQQISFASGLGDFETIRALHLLRKGKFVRLVNREGVGERREDAGLLRLLVRFAFYFVLLGLAVGLFFFRPHLIDDMIAKLESPWTVLDPSIVEAQEARLRTAIELHYALYGNYPNRLETLADRELIADDELVLAKEQFGCFTSGTHGYLLERADCRKKK